MKPALPTCLPPCLPTCPPPPLAGVVGILGSTYNGEFEDIKGLNDMLGEHAHLSGAVGPTVLVLRLAGVGPLATMVFYSVSTWAVVV
jgi:hypothetical protein